ncbi:MAG: hypothetical protein HY979_00345 [Candidatus Magasanikbacteria bacterium]|nr:hypothetical protein [Candidatus Magasanikbacteria bacterium]
MTSKINLFFSEFDDIEIRRAVPQFKIIRLMVNIAFREKDGQTRFYPAIIDTGSHLSLIPKSIWERCSVHKIKETRVAGLSSKEESFLPVTIGTIECIIAGEENFLVEKEIYAYLSADDENPILLGFWDLLQFCRASFDYQKKEAFLEWEE